MPLQDFLAFSAASLAALFIAQIFILGLVRLPGARTTLAQCALVIAVAVAGQQFFPDFYGTVSLIALIVMLAPPLLAQRANNVAIRGHHLSAARWMRLAAVIRPSAQMRFEAAVLAARCAPTAEQWIAALERINAASPAQQTLIALQKLQAAGDWRGVVNHLATLTPEMSAHAALVAIRAFGETGATDRLVQAFLRCGEQALSLQFRQFIQLMVLAFCGRVEATERALAGQAVAAPGLKLFWTATALQAAGRHKEAKELLASRSDLTPAEQASLDWRSTHAAPPATLLSTPTLRLLSDLEATVIAQTAPRPPLWKVAPLTLLLIAANLAYFGLEVWTGDPESSDTLLALGAMLPDAIIDNHEYWRLGTAMFLHAGVLHLLSNILALWILGKLVESSLGWLRTLVIYGLGGLASMAGVMAMMQLGVIEPDPLVGASGAIFALFGAIAATRITGYLRFRSLAGRRDLLMVAAILVIQFTVDIIAPQVSFLAHGLGFVAGALLALMLRPGAQDYDAGMLS